MLNIVHSERGRNKSVVDEDKEDGVDGRKVACQDRVIQRWHAMDMSEWRDGWMDKVCSELRALNARCCRDGADEVAHALLCIYAIAILDTEAPRINSRTSQTSQASQASKASQTAEAEVEAESQCFVIDVGAWTRQDRVQGWREKQDGRHKTTYRIEAHCPDGVPEHNITHHSALVDRQVPVLAGGRGKL